MIVQTLHHFRTSPFYGCLVENETIETVQPRYRDLYEGSSAAL
jgi:hypothetical protein